MTNAKIIALSSLGLALLVSGCDELVNRGVVKSLHGEGTARPYVVCQEGSTFREVNLSDAILKQVKVGDQCPTWDMPYPTATTTEQRWR